MVVLPDLTNTNPANEPIQLIETLAARTSEIRAFIPRLSGDLIQKNRLDTRAPEWSGTPQWLSADTGSIAFTVTFSVYYGRCLLFPRQKSTLVAG